MSEAVLARGPAPLCILLLEDLRVDAEFLQHTVERARPEWQVHWVKTEDAYCRALEAGGHAVILSDYTLPGFSGAEALELAQHLRPELPFILVSGVVGEENAVEMLRKGATDFVSKSRLSRLPMVVERALREVRERQEREAAHEALRQAKEEAERANRAKDRFLAVLSHELRTPLTPISNAVHLLEKKAVVPPALEGLLPMIRRNVALEARLIDDLLDLTSIGQGKLHLQFGEVNAHQIVNTVAEMLGEDLAQKDLRLQIELQATASDLQGDEARLQQIIWNVVRNAVKFTPEGGRITLRSSNPDAHTWELACTDTGIGIHPQALPRIFTAFEQADEGVTRKFGGLGLGLAIARSLAVQHHGQLEAFSEGVGHGATFRLRLPLLTAGVPVAAEPAHAPVAAGRRGLRVLLVEDNEDAAQTLQMALEHFGHDAVVAGTCAEALRCAEAERFDVVVTDLGLPDGSGLQLGHALGRRLPVVALSGYGSENDIHLTREAGFAHHLTKPIDPETLHELLVEIGPRRDAR
jgi:signal transduction histidine kinase